MNLIDFGADPNGRSDSSDAIQAALDEFSMKPNTGILRIPVGFYIITKPLVYLGSWTKGLRISGEIGAAAPSGSVLVWKGGSESVIELTGCNSTILENITIDGGKSASSGIAVSYDHSRGQGTTNVSIRDCVVGSIAKGEETAAIRIGYYKGKQDNYMCDSVHIRNCTLKSEYGQNSAGYGIATGVGNAKNFTVRDSTISGFRVGARHGGSGFFLAEGCLLQSNTNVDIWGAGNTIAVRDCNSEGSSRLFRGTMGKNAGSADISNCTFSSDIVPPDDVVVAYGGYLRLNGCQFWNNRNGSSSVKVQIGPSQGAATTLLSTGNCFFRTKIQPFFDGSGNDMLLRRGKFYTDDYPPFIMSFGDYGGTPGGLIPFNPIIPR